MTIEMGYIGLGNIGKPMCETLLKNGQEHNVAVTAYDVFDEPVNALVEQGASRASSLAELARKCLVIGVCVRDDNDVDALLYGGEGLLENAKAGTVIAIHSTVTRDNTVRWAQDAAVKNIDIIDAAITGGPHGAAAGELGIMVGGTDEALAKAQLMLDLTSKVVVHGGPVGSGVVLKLANNLMNYLAFTAAVEGVSLVEKAGLDPQKLLEIGHANQVVQPMMHMFISGRIGLKAGCTPEEAASIFAPPAGLAEKDLDHTLELAEQLGVDIPVTASNRKRIAHTFLQQ